MPTPSDPAAPDMAQLARDCEARAAAGEKPVLEWKVDSRGRFCWLLGAGPAIEHIEAVRNKFRLGSSWASWQFTSIVAAQIFAESLLRAATAPLHLPPPVTFEAVDIDPEYLERNASLSLNPGDPIQLRTRLVPAQAPEVAAAVACARHVLGFTVTYPDADPNVLAYFLNVLRTHGLIAKIGEPGYKLSEPTALGRALLASATPDPAPTPEEANDAAT